MHSKQLKHFKPLNPDRRREREREGKSDRERCDEEGGAAAEPRESLFPSGRWQMPYVLSTALVLILGGSRQAHIRLCDLCTPPSSQPFSLLPLGGWIRLRGAPAFSRKRSFFVDYVPSTQTETLLKQIIYRCWFGCRLGSLSFCRKGPLKDCSGSLLSKVFPRFWSFVVFRLKICRLNPLWKLPVGVWRLAASPVKTEASILTCFKIVLLQPLIPFQLRLEIKNL